MNSIKLSSGYSIINFNYNKYKLREIFIEGLNKRLNLKKKIRVRNISSPI